MVYDGSDINIPTTDETIEKYGSASVRGGKPCAQIGLGCIYDVLNRFILESSINTVKFDEMRVAQEQLKGIKDTIGNRYPYLVVMDRGYPSTPAFLNFMQEYAPNVKLMTLRIYTAFGVSQTPNYIRNREEIFILSNKKVLQLYGFWCFANA